MILQSLAIPLCSKSTLMMVRLPVDCLITSERPRLGTHVPYARLSFLTHYVERQDKAGIAYLNR